MPAALVLAGAAALVVVLVVVTQDDNKTAAPSSTASSIPTTTTTEPIADTVPPQTTLAGVPGEIFLEPATGVGPLPFTPSVDDTPPEIAIAAPGEPLAPAAPFPGSASPPTAPGVVQAVSGAAPGLYGGTRDRSTCNAEQMVTFLEANPDKAAAWAAVQQIDPSQIRAYVATLTPLLLRTDTRVTNYGFVDGAAPARQVVLQAGTAVLVDEVGVPRARCFCGNPLREPQPEPTPTYTGDAWPGFDQGNVTVIAPSPEPLDVITFIDVVTAVPFDRPVGTDGTSDASAPSTDATAQGAVAVSSEFPGGEFPAALAFDGDPTTSWFSSGDSDLTCVPITPGVRCSELTWVDQRPGDSLISNVEILGNSQHPQFPTGFGFGSVVVIISDSSGTVVLQQTIELPGDDPDLLLTPGVRGHSIRLVFEGHDSPDCGGISEFRVLTQP